MKVKVKVGSLNLRKLKVNCRQNRWGVRGSIIECFRCKRERIVDREEAARKNIQNLRKKTQRKGEKKYEEK